MDILALLSCLIVDIQGLTATAIVVSSVLSAIGIMLIFLIGRFIKSYDDGLKTNAEEIKNIKLKIEDIEQSIVFNVGEREKQIAAVDRKIYDGSVQGLEHLRKLEHQLKDQDMKLQELMFTLRNFR